jgi:hypothetical protein
LDGSPEALNAARYGAAEAEARDATLILAHATELRDVWYTSGYLKPWRSSGNELRQELPNYTSLRV